MAKKEYSKRQLSLPALLIAQCGEASSLGNLALSSAALEAWKSSFFGLSIAPKNGLEGLEEGSFLVLDDLEKDDLHVLSKMPGFSFVIDERMPEIGYVLLIGDEKAVHLSRELKHRAVELGKDVRIVVVPTSYDNSLKVGDHTVGYPSAAKALMNYAKMAHDASLNGISIIEVPGRGDYLTASLHLLDEKHRPDLIFLHALEMDEKSIVEAIQEAHKAKDGLIVAIPSDHLVKADRLATILGRDARVLKPDFVVTMNPYLVSSLDYWEADASATMAVMGFKNQDMFLPSLTREEDYPYKSVIKGDDIPLEGNLRREFPEGWAVSPKEIAHSFIDYLLPLVKGEAPLPEIEDGVYKSIDI